MIRGAADEGEGETVVVPVDEEGVVAEAGDSSLQEDEWSSAYRAKTFHPCMFGYFLFSPALKIIAVYL